MSRRKTKLVHGVGINDADYIVATRRKDGYTYTCPIYGTWVRMLGRCFYPKQKEQNPCYLNTHLYDDWYRFSTFKEWVEGQTYLDLSGKKLNLDKDLLVQGNQEYSPDKCVFVPARINTLLLTNGRSRGEQPIGVYLHTDKKSKPFRASVNDNFDGRIRSSYFDTAQEAHAWWQKEKANIIREAIDLWKVDPVHKNSYKDDVVDAILSRASLLDHHRAEGIETKYL
jgi:hypothetical protein